MEPQTPKELADYTKKHGITDQLLLEFVGKGLNEAALDQAKSVAYKLKNQLEFIEDWLIPDLESKIN